MPSVSYARLRELESKESQLDDIRLMAILAPFTKDLCNSIGLILANTPYSQWPQVARVAFDYAARQTPTTAGIYKSRLPEESING